MSVSTKDGVEVYYKDWGRRNAQPIMFHHGCPLSSDDWDAQMLYFVGKGYRVVAHDRRGHGRSSQVSDGHDMDHYASDVPARSGSFLSRGPGSGRGNIFCSTIRGAFREPCRLGPPEQLT